MLVPISPMSQAAGMVPESTVVLVNVADGEGTMNVTNSGDKAMLLYTSLENLPEDQDSLLVVSPPMGRVEAGEKRLVRFIQSEQPITAQRLKHVTFEGIPQSDPAAKGKIGVTVRQKGNARGGNRVERLQRVT
ncbi:fimbria/pilus periplasmic chaperone [Pseudomonas sp. RIT288]|uniref:fimbria/pilus periplasmic chaperone n=1 Tax=Pseudomonas sp. RIT288 TaxID=1470589 RepID=UPI00044B55DC|nr:fimbria/pilus periplasmic chaperone [Pseudomonas sp. RIT288]EZP32988.1 pili assembly chaperone [Pseudomonas sp. RIT288]